MPDTKTADPVADRLAAMRKRYDDAAAHPGTSRQTVAASADDVPYLVAALEAVLAPHRRGRIVILGALCPRHEDHRHFSITSVEAAGIVACQECAATVYDSCAGCGPQMRLDSCPARVAISAALIPGETTDA